mgnify:FL=1
MSEIPASPSRFFAQAEEMMARSARLEQIHERVQELRAEATSPRGAVIVSLRHDGLLADVVFSSAATRLSGQSLAGEVRRAHTRALELLLEQVESVAVEGLGEHDEAFLPSLLQPYRDAVTRAQSDAGVSLGNEAFSRPANTGHSGTYSSGMAPGSRE